MFKPYVFPGFKKGALYCCIFLSTTLVFVSYPFTSNKHIQLSSNGKPCRLPQLDPFDKTLDAYRSIPMYKACANYSSLLLVDNNGYLQLNKSAVLEYALMKISCIYYKIHRVNGDKLIRLDQHGVKFEPPVFVPNRLFRVVCKIENNTKIYDFVHINMAWNESLEKEEEIGIETDNKLSLLFIGLDSMSRSQTIRNLPKTFKYLTETLGAYDFRGYTKVGLNTFPNMFPLLTGEYPEHYYFVNVKRLRYFDTVPFVWNEPPMKEYATLFSEDRLDIATMNDPPPGFKKSPTDYYYRPFSLAMDEYEPVILKPLGKSNMFCYGNKDHSSIQIDYFKRFISKYTGKLKFAFLWRNGVNHDLHNYEYWDDIPLSNLLRWLKMNGHLDRSVLIVGSDHGPRTSGAGSTHVGRLENNMPLLTMYIPDILKQLYPWMHETLEQNTDKLVSVFDIFKTMKSIVNHQLPEIDTTNSKLGQHLFSRISEMRTCADAGIPPQYCTCFEEVTVEVSKPIVLKLASFAVQNLNSLLQKHNKVCHELYLHNVTLAKVVYTSEGDDDRFPIKRRPGYFDKMFRNWENDESGRYIIVFYTKPNFGLLEAMIEYEKHPPIGRKSIEILGDPARLNRYGNQSHCISEKTLKQYCLCFDITINTM